MSYATDPEFRRWWKLTEEFCQRMARIHVWRTREPPAHFGTGHLHATATSVACLAGVVRISSRTTLVDLNPGDALIIGPGIWHSHEPLRNQSIWLGQGFMPTRSDILIGDSQREWRGALPMEPSKQLMEKLLWCPEEARKEQYAELLRQLLGETVVDLSFESDPLKKMVERLWSSLHRSITADDLVRVSGVSRAQAFRLFKAGYGMSPKKAIETTRLWLADDLLRMGLSIGEVALGCGYENSVTFSRAYKRTRGMSPRTAAKTQDADGNYSGTGNECNDAHSA